MARLKLKVSPENLVARIIVVVLLLVAACGFAYKLLNAPS